MTKAQAAKLAKQIFDQFDKQIVEATRGTHIPPRFIAGLIANEAGKDKAGNIKRSATRFEPHVYAKLKSVRSNPRGKYGSVTHKHLKDATDAALRALATSHEATQIMGYHVIALGCTLADLRNPDKHFFYTVKLLQLNGFPKDATEAQMDREMRQWNTGRETGKTYHANYVPNAQLIRNAYKELEKGRTSRTVMERVNLSSSADPSAEASMNTPTFEEGPPPETHHHLTTEGQPATQQADTIVNTGDIQPEPLPVEDMTITAPPKDETATKGAKATIFGIAVPASIYAIFKAIQDAISQGFISAGEIGSAVLAFVQGNFKWIAGGVGIYIVLRIIKLIVKQITLWISMLTMAVPTWNNVKVKPDTTHLKEEVPARWWEVWK